METCPLNALAYLPHTKCPHSRNLLVCISVNTVYTTVFTEIHGSLRKAHICMDKQTSQCRQLFVYMSMQVIYMNAQESPATLDVLVGVQMNTLSSVFFYTDVRYGSYSTDMLKQKGDA